MRNIALIALACTALWCAPRRVVLLEELVRVEAMEHRTVVRFPLQQQPAEIDVRFALKTGGEGVLIRVYEVDTNRAVAESKYEISGALRAALIKDREYRVEVENRRQRLGFGLVDMEVALVFGSRAERPAPGEGALTLDPKRRYFTVAASLALFAMIFTYSAVRLTPPILERLRGQR